MEDKQKEHAHKHANTYEPNTSSHKVLTWSLQFTLAAGQVIQTEVHKQNMAEIRYYGSNAKEPA